MEEESIIIDRCEEDKNRDFEEAFAEGMGISVEELREGVKELIDYEEKVKKYEEEVKIGKCKNMVISWGHTALAGKIMLSGSWRKLIK